MATEVYPEDDGLLPCETCDGAGEVDGATCPACGGEAWFHPFMGFAEYRDQVRERHPDAVFVRHHHEEDSR